MTNVIEYPVRTSEWGKALIDTLNPIIDRLEKLIAGVNENTNQQFKTFKEEFNNKIDDIKGTATSALTLAQHNEQSIQTMSSRIDSLETTCAKLSVENKSINIRNDKLEFTCEQLSNENRQLKQHTNNLDNYSRRSNVVIRGITEPQQESNADCERAARDFFKDQLKLSDDVVGAVKFERCHRLGNRAAFRRPAIVRFSNYKDKLIVWDAKFKLTDHRFSVSDNFSRDTEFRRRKLFAIHKKAKTMDKFKKKTTLNGDILVVDSVRYSIDNLQMLPPELNPRQFGEKSNGTHLVFGGIHSDHQPFTNWYPSKLCYKEHRFGSVEQAYQWAKATYAKDTRVARKLLYTTNPRVAKNLGRSVKGLTATTWDAEKKNIMKELVSIKFTDNADLKKELLDSNDLKLADAGLDLFYGIGLTMSSSDIFDPAQWKRQNNLGTILESVRASMRI